MKNFSKKEIHYSLFGNLLGDAYLRKNKTTYHWVESCHTDSQKEYVEWLEKLYKQWNLKTHTRYSFSRKTNYGEFYYSVVSCKMQTNRHVNFNRLYNSKGEKIFSDYVSKRITIFGLLLWFLDDGSLSIHKKQNGSISRHAKLCTENFSFENHLKIQKMFKDRFNINVKIYKSKNEKYHIYFNAENFRKFFDLIREYIKYIPECMYYKFNMKYTPNRLKNSKNLLNYNLPEQFSLLNNRN